MQRRTPPPPERALPIACALLLSLAALPVAASDPTPAAAPARPAIEVMVDQPSGRIDVAAAANVAYEDAYGPTVSPLTEVAFRWVRASPSLRSARCSQWLGDGIRATSPRAFSGCRVYREGAGGVPEYHWEGLDRSLDVMVASGVKPVLVCGGMPDALAAGTERSPAGGMISRPKDYGRYQALIEALVRHVEKTYGRDEVRGWCFEVWDQPDRAGYWEGGGAPPGGDTYPPDRLAPFLKLYDAFAAGAASADPQVRVGGPGTAGDPRFLRGFLAHCARGPNAVTGDKGARLDFISLHAAEPAAARAQLRADLAAHYPELARAALFVCSPASAGTTAVGYGPAGAARVAAAAEALASGPAGEDRFFLEAPVASDHFAGDPALITRLGRYTVPLPAYRAMMMLGKMGGERVLVKLPDGLRGFATRSGKDGAQVLLYRDGTGAASLPVRLRVQGLPRSLVATPLHAYMLDSQHQNPYGMWLAAGKPAPAPDLIGSTCVSDAVYPATREDASFNVAGGVAEVDLDLEADSAALVTLGQEPAPKAPDKPARARRVLDAEQAYEAAAAKQGERDYPMAERRYLEVAKKYSDVFWAQVSLATLVEMYAIDLRRPEQAEATRERLLAMPVDDFERVRLLRQRLITAVRAGETTKVDAIRKEIGDIDARLAAATGQ